MNDKPTNRQLGTIILTRMVPSDKEVTMATRKTKYLTKALRCPDGSRKYIRGKTKEELEAKVQAARMQLGMGVNLNDNTTFVEYAQTWVNVYKRPNLKSNSLENLLTTINQHIIPHLGAMRMRDIKPVHAAAVMAAAKNLSHGYQMSILNIMRAIFRSAEENHVIMRSPVVSTVKAGGREAKEREPLTPEQCERLLRAAKDHSDDLYAFVLLGLYTGMRRGEILGLCWDCVDFDARKILVRRQLVIRANRKIELTETLKTKGSYRVLPMPFVLEEYLRGRKERIGGTNVFRISGRSPVERIWHNLDHLCKYNSSGQVTSGTAPLDFHCNPHLLRHTYATRLFEGGLDIKDVQYLLGHSTPSMTLRVYVHYDKKSRQQSTAEKVEAALPKFTTVL